MKRDKLEERGGEWYVLSEAGEELSGPFTSREQAAERLRQIEAAKAARGADVSDGATVRRFDYLGELHTDPERTDGVLMRPTPEGFLRADARLTRVGVFNYSDAEGNSWGELRTPDEVFHPNALRSFELVSVTNEHPADFVSTDNVRDVDVGTVGTDVRQDGRFVRASIVVKDSETIKAIRDGKRELSCGYTATIVAEDGMAKDGMPYAGRQTNIRGNHVAIVSKGRAGPECSMMLGRGDAFTQLTKVGEMKTKKIKLADGTEVEVPAEVADALESRADAVSVTIGDTKYSVHPAVAAALEDAKKGKPAFMEPDKDKDKDKDKDEDKDGDGKSKDDASALRAKVDTLEARATEDAATFNARVDARSRLVSDARTVLGSDHKVDGVGDEELMAAIVLDVLPSMRERLAANKNDAGYLRCAYEQAMAHHQRGDEAVRDTNETVFHAINDGGGDVLEDALRFYDARADRAMAAGE